MSVRNVFALLALTILLGGCMSGERNDPLLDPAPPPDPATDSVILAPTVFEETAYLFEIALGGDEPVQAFVNYTAVEPAWDGHFAHQVRLEGADFTQYGGMWLYGVDRPLLRVQAGGLMVPVGPPVGTLPIDLMWPQNQSYELELQPGAQHLVVGAQGPPVMVSVEAAAAQVSSRLVLQDPDLVRWLSSHVPGHWDSVELEVLGPIAGTAKAETTFALRHSSRDVGLFTFGYGEVALTEEDGARCEDRTEPFGSLPIAFVIQPKLGSMTAETLFVQPRDVATAFLHIWDLPIEPTWDERRCIAFSILEDLPPLPGALT